MSHLLPLVGRKIFTLVSFCAGDAGRQEGDRGALCNQNTEKRCGDSGRWCWVYNGWKTSAGFAG